MRTKWKVATGIVAGYFALSIVVGVVADFGSFLMFWVGPTYIPVASTVTEFRKISGATVVSDSAIFYICVGLTLGLLFLIGLGIGRWFERRTKPK